MKKIFAVLLASMMAATALVGCGGSGDSSTASKTESKGDSASATSNDFGDEDNITLKVWAPDNAVSTFEKECEAFKALYPDKKIDITVVAQTEKDAATNLLMMPQLLPMYSVSQVTSSTSFRQQALLHRLLMLKIFLREIQQSQFQLQHSTVRFTLIRKQVITVTTSYMISQ